MRINLTTPHLISWLSIPLLMLIGILSWGKSIDIQMHDTYYVVDILYFCTLASMHMGVIGLGYWVVVRLKGNLHKVLSGIHLAYTIGFFLLIIILAYYLSASDYDDWGIINSALLLGFAGLLVSQLVYLTNLLAGLIGFKKR